MPREAGLRQAAKPPKRERRTKNRAAASSACCSARCSAVGLHRARPRPTGLWTLGFARFMFPNILTEPPSKFKVGFPSDFAPGQGRRRSSKRSSASGSCNSEYNGQPMIFALKYGLHAPGLHAELARSASRSSNAPATAAVFTRTASTSKARPRGRSNATRSGWPTTASLKSTRARTFQEEMGQWTDPASFVPV